MAEQNSRGVRIGVDVGSVRVGVAASDPDGMLATPVATLRRERAGADLDELAGIVVEYGAVEIAVGLPRHLRGHDGAAVSAARDYAGRLTGRLERLGAAVPVVFVDERLTSVTANRQLAERGVRARQRRSVVDQLAAVAILQARLDALRAGEQR